MIIWTNVKIPPINLWVVVSAKDWYKVITLVDMSERLKKLEETLLLEVLDISSEDIVDRFQDKIEEKFDELSDDLTEEWEE